MCTDPNSISFCYCCIFFKLKYSPRIDKNCPWVHNSCSHDCTDLGYYFWQKSDVKFLMDSESSARYSISSLEKSSIWICFYIPHKTESRSMGECVCTNSFSDIIRYNNRRFINDFCLREFYGHLTANSDTRG